MATLRKTAVKTKPEHHELIQQQNMLEIKAIAINGLSSIKEALTANLKRTDLSVGELDKLLSMLLKLSTIPINPKVQAEVKEGNNEDEDSQEDKNVKNSQRQLEIEAARKEIARIYTETPNILDIDEEDDGCYKYDEGK